MRLAHVDALSRAPLETNVEIGEERAVVALHNAEDEVRVYQYVEDEIRKKKLILKKPVAARMKPVRSQIHDYELHEGIVYKNRKGCSLYVIPSVMRKSLVVRFHDHKSHPGVEHLASRIAEHYYFLRMRLYVKHRVNACLQCIAKRGRGSKRGSLIPFRPGRDRS